MTSRAIVIGSAACLGADLAALGDIDALRIGTNHHGYLTRDLDAVATLHPEHIAEWRELRKERGWPDVPWYCHDRYYVDTPGARIWRSDESTMDPAWAGSSTGLYAAGVARYVYGADVVILAGCPLDQTPNPLTGFKNYRKFHGGLKKVAPIAQGWLYSMSGRTAEYFGRPTIGGTK